jgi:CRP-like cAMP-binding protein
VKPAAAELELLPLFSSLTTGQVITHEGASGYSFFVILDGTADVRKDDRVIATLGPGDHFGEIALLGEGGRRIASVVATSPMRFAAMFGTDFRQMQRELPEVAAELERSMAARLAEPS